MLNSFYWKVRGADQTRRPSGEEVLLGVVLEDVAVLGNHEGCRGALLLTLNAGDAALLDEEAESCTHLLSRDAKRRSHLLVGNGGVLLNKGGENILAEVNDLLVHLRLAGTSGRALKLVDLLLAELDDLGIVREESGDAGVEVLLGGLVLGHDSHFFLGLASLSLRVPTDSLFCEEVILFFLYILYHILVYFVKYFLLDLLTFSFTGRPFFPSFSLFFNYIITYFIGWCQYVIF